MSYKVFILAIVRTLFVLERQFNFYYVLFHIVVITRVVCVCSCWREKIMLLDSSGQQTLSRTTWINNNIHSMRHIVPLSKRVKWRKAENAARKSFIQVGIQCIWNEVAVKIEKQQQQPTNQQAQLYETSYLIMMWFYCLYSTIFSTACIASNLTLAICIPLGKMQV